MIYHSEEIQSSLEQGRSQRIANQQCLKPVLFKSQANMLYSAHQLAFFAHQLTRRAASSSMEEIAGVLLDVQVDLSPHQIDAAVFATSSPLSKIVIFADEVAY